MNKVKNSGSFYLVLISLIVFAFAIGTYFFLSEVNQYSISVQNGAVPQMKVLNSYKYKQNLTGLIYSGTFLVAGLLFFTMIILPSDSQETVAVDVPTPHAKRSAPVASGEGSTQIAQVTEQEVERIQSSEAASEQIASSEEQVAQAIDRFKPAEPKEIVEGEDDVVFGSGPISEEAVVDFVNKYPDSAVKFLFRKNLDGKNLDPETDDIYKSWEYRGMNRGQVRSYILNIMEWDDLPNDPLHEVWKKLRDQIFELIH